MWIEPGHPFQRCQLDGLPCFPGAAMYQFSLVQTVDRFRQRVDAPMSRGASRIGQIGKDERVQFPDDVAFQAAMDFPV